MRHSYNFKALLCIEDLHLLGMGHVHNHEGEEPICGCSDLLIVTWISHKGGRSHER